MTASAARQQATVDTASCDREPIHVPGSVQPHGALLVLDAAGRVVQASANIREFLALSVDRVLGAKLTELLGEQAIALIASVERAELEKNPTHIGAVNADNGARLEVIGHRIGGLAVIELETAAPGSDALSFARLHPLVRTFVGRLATTDDDPGRLAAEEVRRITGFDRVLVYRFDEDWHGTVVAEDRNDELPSYLDLRFPASDIPRQARELYRLNRLRLIADAEYQPVPLEPGVNPVTGGPLDMSFATLRSVSPVHVEYMKNMGTGSSMSISLLRDGELWGLISCHSKRPRKVPFEVRAACDFLGQVLSMQISAREHAADVRYRLKLQSIQARLLAHMAGEDSYLDALARSGDELMELADAQGVAIVAEDRCTLIGLTPAEIHVRRLVKWLQQEVRLEVFDTDSISAVWPEAATYCDKACGVLAVSISKLHASYVLWFRPEWVQTVTWGGDPRKSVADGKAERLHPRKSFEMWKETVRGRSRPWLVSQVDATADLRNTIVGIVLQKAEELAQLTHELEVSNKELEAFSYSVSHDLRAPFRHIVGYAELLRERETPRLSDNGKRYIDTIIESAQYAGKLVDSLLAFSRMNRASLARDPIDTQRLVEEVRRDVEPEAAGRAIEWTVHPMPDVIGDLLMLRLVWRNLLSNAVKYTRPRDVARIEIAARTTGGDAPEHVFSVRDNGVGFDMEFVDKLFGIFQRLHKMEDFEGTGIGLANVRRIVTRHGGRAWAEGAVDGGATFYFSLPVNPESIPVSESMRV